MLSVLTDVRSGTIVGRFFDASGWGNTSGSDGSGDFGGFNGFDRDASDPGVSA
jgi:hypothetical protein